MSGALPDLDFEPTRGFWDAAARDELAVPRCSGCARYVWYPQAVCPHCGGDEMPWEAVCGRGRLFSWATVERALFKPFATKGPYVTGLVALEEDPSVRIVTDIVDCEPSELVIDMPVQAVFRELSFPDEEGSVRAPFFRPVDLSNAQEDPA
jgi:uncharacterized OB-fold protein